MKLGENYSAEALQKLDQELKQVTEGAVGILVSSVEDAYAGESPEFNQRKFKSKMLEFLLGDEYGRYNFVSQFDQDDKFKAHQKIEDLVEDVSKQIELLAQDIAKQCQKNPIKIGKIEEKSKVSYKIVRDNTVKLMKICAVAIVALGTGFVGSFLGTTAAIYGGLFSGGIAYIALLVEEPKDKTKNIAAPSEKIQVTPDTSISGRVQNLEKHVYDTIKEISEAKLKELEKEGVTVSAQQTQAAEKRVTSFKQMLAQQRKEVVDTRRR